MRNISPHKQVIMWNKLGAQHHWDSLFFKSGIKWEKKLFFQAKLYTLFASLFCIFDVEGAVLLIAPGYKPNATHLYDYECAWECVCVYKCVCGVCVCSAVCLSLKTDTLTKAAVLSKQSFNVSIRTLVVCLTATGVQPLLSGSNYFCPSVCAFSTLLRDCKGN